ncbi:cytochrome P450 [Solirubrobacter phytolaccae]|uniref:Cytochrome P450 n=1 Tax=Solirubrobacter phytolaccae TaxID=1404360 RepID=A0A9X3NCT9_9ACTN|nr:cytochrome P450 [Solirubrobacter phytolaccae]MDA0184088.1 cytochrome P450 [Solirubrobacter phytolaccae]
MLPPGPKAPAAVQTVEWIVRPTKLLRDAEARYGDAFTLRTAYWDAPMVLTSDPDAIKRVYAAPPDVLQGGDAAAFMEPFVGAKSLLILHGDEHLRQRRLVLPPFHGQALKRWTEQIRAITHEQLDTWPVNTPFKALPKMQELTLDVIERVIFGTRDPELKQALRAALDLTGSTTNLIAMSLIQRDIGPYGRFLKAVERIDELVYARIDQPSTGDSILDLLRDSGATRAELRDQLVTLLAAGHETTATALAWALERLARHPTDLTQDPDPFIDEVLRTRPVLSITARKTLQPYELGGYTLPEGVYVAPCIYLANRRGRPIPWGGGTRRCVGAAFAQLELREVLRAVSERFSLRPVSAEGERMRRRSITLAPARGAEIIANPLA